MEAVEDNIPCMSSSLPSSEVASVAYPAVRASESDVDEPVSPIDDSGLGGRGELYEPASSIEDELFSNFDGAHELEAQQQEDLSLTFSSDSDESEEDRIAREEIQKMIDSRERRARQKDLAQKLIEHQLIPRPVFASSISRELKRLERAMGSTKTTHSAAQHLLSPLNPLFEGKIPIRFYVKLKAEKIDEISVIRKEPKTEIKGLQLKEFKAQQQVAECTRRIQHLELECRGYRKTVDDLERERRAAVVEKQDMMRALGSRAKALAQWLFETKITGDDQSAYPGNESPLSVSDSDSLLDLVNTVTVLPITVAAEGSTSDSSDLRKELSTANKKRQELASAYERLQTEVERLGGKGDEVQALRTLLEHTNKKYESACLELAGVREMLSSLEKDHNEQLSLNSKLKDDLDRLQHPANSGKDIERLHEAQRYEAANEKSLRQQLGKTEQQFKKERQIKARQADARERVRSLASKFDNHHPTRGDVNHILITQGTPKSADRMATIEKRNLNASKIRRQELIRQWELQGWTVELHPDGRIKKVETGLQKLLKDAEEIAVRARNRWSEVEERVPAIRARHGLPVQPAKESKAIVTEKSVEELEAEKADPYLQHLARWLVEEIKSGSRD